MKIGVLVKQVAGSESPLRIDSSEKWVEEGGIDFTTNESDSYALEEALQIIERSGGEGEVELKKKLNKIGKDPASDVPVSGLLVGKTAATVSKRPTGFYISFVEGMSKPKVNGKAIKGSVKLKEFDVIEIGSARMEFILKE